MLTVLGIGVGIIVGIILLYWTWTLLLRLMSALLWIEMLGWNQVFPVPITLTAILLLLAWRVGPGAVREASLYALGALLVTGQIAAFVGRRRRRLKGRAAAD